MLRIARRVKGITRENWLPPESKMCENGDSGVDQEALLGSVDVERDYVDYDFDSSSSQSCTEGDDDWDDGDDNDSGGDPDMDDADENFDYSD